MDSTFFKIQIYSIPNTINILKLNSIEEAFKKSSLLSTFKVDLLTIAIGPEHHDICLLDVKKPHNGVGRISFNITSSHIERVNLRIKNIQCKIFNLLQSEVALKLKFKEFHNYIESDYTDPINPNRLQKEEVTIYNWIEKGNESKISNNKLISGQNFISEKNTMSINTVLSMIELRSSNASINMFDIIYVDSASVNEESNIVKDIFTMMSKPRGTIRYQSGAEDKNFNNFANETNNILLRPKYTHIGCANLNFYKILSENDSIITKQSSRIFQMIFHEGMKCVEKWNSPRDKEQHTPLAPMSGGGTKGGGGQVIKFNIFENITRNFHEDIFFQGNEIGKIEGCIEITKVPLIRQIMCGVHNEHGFDIHSVHLNFDMQGVPASFKDRDGSTAPPELKILANQTNNLLQQLVKGTNLTQVTQSYREINSQICCIMREIKQVLEKSSKESCLYYQYFNNKDLFKAQRIMMELGINVLKVIESFNLEQRAIAFEILNLINNRAEFDLGTVSRAWFVDHSNNSEFAFRCNSLLHEKIIDNFIYFNNSCLEFTLDRLSRGKSVEKESRVFVEFFVSVAYFRIPKFRNSFLEVISKDLYTDNLFTNNVLEKQTSKIEDFLNLDPINNLILWEFLFYKRLESALSTYQHDTEIADRLKDTENIIRGSIEEKSDAESVHEGAGIIFGWKERIEKRGIAFCSIIIRLEQYIRKKVVKDMDIKWNNIPGFNIIFDAIIHELKTKETTSYTPQLIELLSLFINDAEIINSFTKAMISTTRVYDTNAVFIVVKIIDSFFSEYEKKKTVSNLSQRFDYSLLKESFKKILDIDHSLSVAKFFWLYYRNAHIMNLEHVAEVFLKILKQKFYYIFFHWSWQVRNIFYFILLFIINHRIRHMSFISSGETSLRRGSVGDIREVTNYPQIMQQELLDEYDNKMLVIEKIKQIVNEEKLDPSFNTNFRAINYPQFKEIPIYVGKNIVVSIYHLKTVEEHLIRWEEDNLIKKFSEVKYPMLEVEPPRDDVIQFTTELTW